MGRPLDPTSRNQVDQRTRRLRDPESGWVRGLSMTVALAALKAHQWLHYLENDGEPGPLAGTFPRLPEELGSRVVVGAEEVVDPELVEHRLLVSHGGQVLTDGQAEGLEIPDGEQLAKARELADLLESRHLRLLLTPTLHREAATWMGDLLASPAPEVDPERERILLGDPHPEMSRVELEDRTCLLGLLQDLWEVPSRPLGLVSETYLGRVGTSREEAAMAAALWEFGRRLYRQLLNGGARPDALGRRGLERPTRLRQLLEELDLLEPSGLKTQPIGEKPLARMTTHEVAALAPIALMRGDLWEAGEDGRGLFSYVRSDHRGYRRWEVTLQEGREDLAFASLARCQQVLEKGGLEVVALHGLLCCHVMQQADPAARFEVAGDDLLKDLGYGQARGGRDGSSRSDLLRKVASAASLLGAVRCEGNARNRSTGGQVSMTFGPMWSIAIRADGQLKLREQPGEEQVGTLTDLNLTVTPGTWVQSQRSLSSGSHLLYAPVATRVLSLGRYRQELAFRLGIHLAMGVRIKGQWNSGHAPDVRVGQLLGEVLPQGVLERALQDRRAAYDLRQQWNAALATLHTVVGFRFEFPPDRYHPSLVPEDLRPPETAEPGPVLQGALEQLLASRLVIHWPELVVEALHQKALPQREREATFQARQQQRAALQSRPNGARLRGALEQAKASGAIQSRAQAAARLGISTAYLSLLVNGKRDLPLQKLLRFLTLLETFGPGKS